MLTEKKYPSRFRPVATIKREVNSSVSRRLGKKETPKEVADRYNAWKKIKDQHGHEIANKWLNAMPMGMVGTQYHNEKSASVLHDLVNPKQTNSFPKELLGFKHYDTDQTKHGNVHKYYHPAVRSAHITYSVPHGAKTGKWGVVNYGKGRPHKLVSAFKRHVGL